MMGSRRAVVYLLLVFLLGGALGVLGTLWAVRNNWVAAGASTRYRSTQGAVEWLSHELNLTSQQAQQLETILDETAAGYRSIRERVGPEYEAVRQQGRDKIRALLTPGQRAKFEELVRRIDEERAQRRQEREQESAKPRRSDKQ